MPYSSSVLLLVSQKSGSSRGWLPYIEFLVSTNVFYWDVMGWDILWVLLKALNGELPVILHKNDSLALYYQFW